MVLFPPIPARFAHSPFAVLATRVDGGLFGTAAHARRAPGVDKWGRSPHKVTVGNANRLSPMPLG
jgi:hypothetical protein